MCFSYYVLVWFRLNMRFIKSCLCINSKDKIVKKKIHHVATYFVFNWLGENLNKENWISIRRFRIFFFFLQLKMFQFKPNLIGLYNNNYLLIKFHETITIFKVYFYCHDFILEKSKDRRKWKLWLKFIDSEFSFIFFYG